MLCYAVQPCVMLLPHELRFGIVRADGSEKPIARRLAALAQERRRIVKPEPLALEEEAYYRGLPASIGKAYAEYTRAGRRSTPA